MKRSAGILPYKFEAGILYVYLEHPGGPYWENVDSWSICKGEYKAEKAIDAAIREFHEEAGVKIPKEKMFFIGSKKQMSTNKLVVVFAAEYDIDPEAMNSNKFSIEWPPNSGEIKEFPEMDRAAWFTIDEAINKVFNGQQIFLNKLKDSLEKRNMLK